MLYVYRLGNSLSVKVVFARNSLPVHVNADFIRYTFRTFVLRANKCTQCWAGKKPVENQQLAPDKAPRIATAPVVLRR